MGELAVPSNFSRIYTDQCCKPQGKPAHAVRKKLLSNFGVVNNVAL